MIQHDVFFGGNEVVASGSVVVPQSQESVSVKIQDLTFKFVFVYDGEKQRILYKGSGQELTTTFYNPPQQRWVGKTSDFLHVGNLGDDDLGMAYFIYAAKNQSHMIKYTFVKMGSSQASSVEEVGDE